jgi:putative hydrolase of the HAD superfamily
MNKFENIKGVIFDYGGTIDTRGDHWFEVLWREYEKVQIKVSKEQLRKAYIFGERSLAAYPFIQPEDDFYEVLRIKIHLQLTYLHLMRLIKTEDISYYTPILTQNTYELTREIVKNSTKVVEKVIKLYKTVLVSNFYGNISTVLKKFNLLCCFEKIIESAVVGVRKPDPAIYKLGVEALNLKPSEILVVGDSIAKDVIPAKTVGCKTVWIKGVGWDDKPQDETLPDAVITDLKELESLLKLNEK